MYKYPIALTQQFRFCGNAFRVDTYKGCDFGCLYCFANSRKGNYNKEYDIADFAIIKNMFDKAFNNKNKKINNINIELLQHKVPLHLGGMSDPFQQREWKYKITYDLLQLSNQYDYPMIISTKCASLPNEYWNILNPKHHAFQISLMGYNDDFIRKYEINTPTVKERITFIKKLKEKGFWVSIRIQPLINLKEAELLIKNIEPYIDYITIEHLKIPNDNKEIKLLFAEYLNSGAYYSPKQGRVYELDYNKKKENILYLQSITKIPIGVGDNELHELTQSKCCCGIDTINHNFDNWLKYNYTYFATSDNLNQDLWYPQSNCRNSFNSECRINDSFKTVKDYVDFYNQNYPFSIFISKNN